MPKLLEDVPPELLVADKRKERDHSNSAAWHAWQKAKAECVKQSWQNGDKKAYWDSQIAEAKAEHHFEMTVLRADFAEVLENQQKIQQFFWEKIEKQNNVVELLLETNTLLLKKARIEELKPKPEEEDLRGTDVIRKEG